MRKVWVVLLSILVLVCGCIYLPASPSTPPTSTTPVEKPVVASFSASPASITSGSGSTLSWSVTGATSVSLDNGIGNVAVNGTRAVAPAATTVYTLTASNSAGSSTASTEVIISGTSTPPSTPPAATGMPSITSFGAAPNSITAGASSTLTWSVSNATSVNIQPGIGNVAVSGSTSVTPGSSTTYTLTATNASGSDQASTQITVAASGGTITPTLPGLRLPPGMLLVTTVYDFIAKAPTAYWTSSVNLTFPGSQSDSNGFALVLSDKTLEDDQVYTEVLEMHPKWTTGGFISGAYTEMADTYTVQSNDHFFAKVGFLKGANAGNVNFKVMIRTTSGENVWVADVTKVYDGTLTTINVPLSAYAGKKADFILSVEANNANAAQAWAVWVTPKITR